MFNSTHNLTLAIPIAPANRQLARQLAETQPTPEKVKQVYLNALAVQVVNVYLQMMDIPTDLEASDSWNYSDRLCLDIADLPITGLGHLECRPIRTGETHCSIPPEVWEDRIGYVVVQIDDRDRSGTILGFVPTATTTVLPINQLQSLDHLLIHFHHLKTTTASSPQSTLHPSSLIPHPSPSHLSQWFNNIFETGWQTIEELFAEKTPAVVFLGQSFRGESDTETTEAIAHLIQTTDDEEARWKAVENLWTLDPNHSASGVRRIIDLGAQLAGRAVALMVAVLRKPDQTVAILLRVYPMGNQRYLPTGLQLTGLYQNGDAFLEAESRDRDDYIQLKFCAEPGEQFGVKIALANASITENFIV